MKTNYIIEYKTTNNLRGFHKFHEYSDAKKIYIALAQNLTIKEAKLYHLEKGRKKLVEKFTKKAIYTLEGVRIWKKLYFMAL